METSYLNYFYVLSFLDSVNLGLIMPVLNPHLLSIGASHTATGLLVSLHCVGQIVATALIKGLSHKYNKRQALIYTLIVALISNFVLAVCSSFWVVFAARLAFYVTNQTQTVLHAYIHATEDNSKHEIIKGVFGALGVGGFLVGPIISGYMFQWHHGFSLVCLLASGISLISILIVWLLPLLRNGSDAPDLTAYILNDLMVSSEQTKIKLLRANVKCNWNVYLLKALVSTSLTAFFMKFSMLLKKHYNASSVVIGYTVAYQSMVMFLMNFALAWVKSLLSPNGKTQLVQILSTSIVAMSGICYAITHGLYMTLFIPLALSRLLLDSVWAAVVFAGRGPEAADAATVFTTITAIVVPVTLGSFCDIMDEQAVKVFAIVPLLLAVFVSVMRFEPIAPQPITDSSSNISAKDIGDNSSDEIIQRNKHALKTE